MDEVKKGIFGVTKAITKGGGTLIKTTKLTLNLSSEEGKLNALYMEIGKKVHEIYSYGGSIGEFFDAKYQEILEQQNKINDIKTALDLAKGVRTCPKCGKGSPRTSVFCSKCGESMGEAAEAEAENAEPVAAYTIDNQAPPLNSPKIEEPVKEEVKQVKSCGICGSVNNIADRFCLSCGRIL